MSAPIDLQATFIPNDGEFFRVKLALEIAIDEVVNEPGCIRYELTEATEEKLVLTETVGHPRRTWTSTPRAPPSRT